MRVCVSFSKCVLQFPGVPLDGVKRPQFYDISWQNISYMRSTVGGIQRVSSWKCLESAGLRDIKYYQSVWISIILPACMRSWVNTSTNVYENVSMCICVWRSILPFESKGVLHFKHNKPDLWLTDMINSCSCWDILKCWKKICLY